MKVGGIAAAAALMMAGAAQAGPAEAGITLLPRASVAAGAVVLGQVAHVRGENLPLVRALVHLPIGQAPAAGRSVVLEREALAAWIRRRLPMPAVLAWSGAERSRVSTESRTIRGDEIAAVASGALRAWLSGRSEDSEVHLAWTPRDVEAPAAGVRLRARPLGASPVRSRMVVWVDVLAGERFVRTVPVSFGVNAWREVATAARRLESGMPLDSSRLARRRVDIAALEGSPLADVATAGDAVRLRHAVASGEPLRARDVAPAPLVRRGEWAALRSGAGAVVSEARVEVLQDGGAGDEVRVRQPGALSQVLARVVGPGRLEVVR